MKDADEATKLTIELARSLVSEMQTLAEPWEKAFIRMEFGDRNQTCKGSYALPDKVHLFDVLQHKQMFHTFQQLWPQLREVSANGGKMFCVALLIVDSSFNFEIQYEYENASRWVITKLGGGDGLPAGYAA